MIQLEAITGTLPPGYALLRAEAHAEGFRLVERLAIEWEQRMALFNREGEALLAAGVNRKLAGIGGVTIDPIMQGASMIKLRLF